LKFSDPLVTARGEPRATVALSELKTLWFNTGTLCNITCRNCYIESSPKNDRLAYLTLREVQTFLDEIRQDGWNTREIGFTGGEPFMNPDIFGMLESCLARRFEVLVLTNAMRPLHQKKRQLLDLTPRFKDALTIRVSLDHYSADRHDEERGPGSFRSTLEGLIWLAHNGFRIAVAGRTMWGEDQASLRAGYAKLFAKHGIEIDMEDSAQMVLFPEMDSSADVPEITTACWDILGKSPSEVMCSHSRMIIKRKNSDRPTVVSCTLLPYDSQFELGHTLREAKRSVSLNHPHCAKFCVLGGASCSAR
jgi:sulfatase maturation enzyme AslB (radical SAM superfamily)